MSPAPHSRFLNRYSQIIERVFFSHHQAGMREIQFERDELARAAYELGITPPKNLGDIIYTFRFRGTLPDSIRATAPEGEEWIIRKTGRSRYSFVAVPPAIIVPNPSLAETKVPDATPGIILMYALNDEQGLLARVRYNHLIDIFTGVTCYSLQNHLRTTVPGIGQIETDELYVGVDQRGAQYAFPVQAKGGNDRLSIVQIEQDFAMCTSKFPALICRPIGAQFMRDDLIALFAFEESDNGLAISAERHYRLVPPEDITPAELETYRTRLL